MVLVVSLNMGTPNVYLIIGTPKKMDAGLARTTESSFLRVGGCDKKPTLSVLAMVPSERWCFLNSHEVLRLTI